MRACFRGSRPRHAVSCHSQGAMPPVRTRCSHERARRRGRRMSVRGFCGIASLAAREDDPEPCARVMSSCHSSRYVVRHIPWDVRPLIRDGLGLGWDGRVVAIGGAGAAAAAEANKQWGCYIRWAPAALLHRRTQALDGVCHTLHASVVDCDTPHRCSRRVWRRGRCYMCCIRMAGGNKDERRCRRVAGARASRVAVSATPT